VGPTKEVAHNELEKLKTDLEDLKKLRGIRGRKGKV
jgi:hypothetical protein